jgi:predicted DNA-binding transcriptional regulator AlpA
MNEAQLEEVINRAASRAVEGLLAQLKASGDLPSSSAVRNLPPGLGLNQILKTEDACKFLGISLAHWRRLRTNGEAPPPVRIGARINGWRVSDLIAWCDSRVAQKREPIAA